MAKKECRRTPTAANSVETLDFQKRAENDTKKNVAADPQLRAGSTLWIFKKGPKMTKKRMSPQTHNCELGRNSGFSKKGPKMTKKECRRRPTAASWVETLAFQKRPKKWPKKNVAVDPQLRAGSKL